MPLTFIPPHIWTVELFVTGPFLVENENLFVPFFGRSLAPDLARWISNVSPLPSCMMTLWHLKHSHDFTILIWNSYTPTPDCDFVQNRGVPNSPLGPAAEFLLKVHLTVVMLLVISTLCFCLTLASMTRAKQQLTSAHLQRARLPIADVISHLRPFPWRDQELTPINDVRLLANSLHLLWMRVLYTCG